MHRLFLSALLLFATALTGCSTHVQSFDALNYSSSPPFYLQTRANGSLATELTDAVLAVQPTEDDRYRLVKDKDGTVGLVTMQGWYFGVDAARGTRGVDTNSVMSVATVATSAAALATNAVPFVSAGLTLARWTVNGVRALAGASADNPIYFLRFDLIVHGNGAYLFERIAIAEPQNGRDKKTLQADIAKIAATVVHDKIRRAGGGMTDPAPAAAASTEVPGQG